MSCIKRVKTGSCSHHQCEFPHKTQRGYICVDLFQTKGQGLKCEAGSGCLPECEYSFQREPRWNDPRLEEKEVMFKHQPK